MRLEVPKLSYNHSNLFITPSILAHDILSQVASSCCVECPSLRKLGARVSSLKSYLT